MNKITLNDLYNMGDVLAGKIEEVRESIPDVPSDYQELADEVTEIKSDLVFAIQNGNNLIPMKNFHAQLHGITIDIDHGIISIRGTSTQAIRAKLSGDVYEARNLVREEWYTETLDQFEVGKTYSFHNEIVSGVLPADTGVSIRNADKQSVISITIPEAELSAIPAIALLYIPKGKTLDVSFIPMVIEGNLSERASNKILNSTIHVTSEQIVGIPNNYETPDMTKQFVYDSTLQSAMKFPSTYSTNGKATPLIILCHGLNSSISSSTWGGTDMMTLVNNFAGEGFAVIDVNQVSSEDWCNPALIEKYVKAITDAVNRYNVEPKIIFAESMGNLIGLCIAKMYPSVKACVVAGLRLDFEARYNDLSSEEKAIVDANLGFVNGYNAYIAAGWDKCAIACVDANSNSINPNQFPPTLFVVGSTDTYNTESLAKIDEIKRGGTICQTNTYTGNHSDVCYLKPGTSFTDAIAWVNKWC